MTRSKQILEALTFKYAVNPGKDMNDLTNLDKKFYGSFSHLAKNVSKDDVNVFLKNDKLWFTVKGLPQTLWKEVRKIADSLVSRS